jgi:hypothetical protein
MRYTSSFHIGDIYLVSLKKVVQSYQLFDRLRDKAFWIWYEKERA